MTLRARAREPRVLICSMERDLHGYAVLDRLRDFKGLKSHLIVTDAMFESGGLYWSLDGSRNRGELRDQDGEWVDVAEATAIWWRRVNQAQQNLPDDLDDGALALIDNEWRASIFGCTVDAFDGTWINPPWADVNGGNKLIQLRVAVEAGLSVPRTIVAQDPDRVRQFCRELGGKVVAKKLMGAGGMPLATVEVTESQLTDDTSIRLCPTIYQELIRGNEHLRVTCFGDEAHAVKITSELLDWRRDLSVPFEPAELPPDLEAALVRLLERLDLRMGVMDLIIDGETGAPIFLELNTQGQFLFAEGLSGYDLTGPFAAFLAREAGWVHGRPSGHV